MLPNNYAFVTNAPVIPVMVIDHIDQAIPMAQALVAGGLTTLEITLRTPCAVDAIAQIATHVKGANVGAGTVCTAEQFDAVVAAGAQFVVSPGHSQALFDASHKHNIPLLPGAVTATEVMAVLNAGFPVIKFFPASTSGGAAAIKAFGGPFGDALFVPTGGIGLGNLADYLSLKNIPAVGGSWIIPADAVANGDWQRVTQLAAEAVELANTIKAS